MNTTTNAEASGIGEIISRFTEAWNLHDAAAFSNLFAENAELTNVLGQLSSGRKAIEKQHAFIFSTRFRQSVLKPEAVHVRLLQENLALVDVGWYMTGSLDLNGNLWHNRKGLVNFILKEEKGRWPVLVAHITDLTTPSGPPKLGTKLFRFFSSSLSFDNSHNDVSELSDEEDRNLRARFAEWLSFKGGFIL